VEQSIIEAQQTEKSGLRENPLHSLDSSTEKNQKKEFLPLTEGGGYKEVLQDCGGGWGSVKKEPMRTDVHKQGRSREGVSE